MLQIKDEHKSSYKEKRTSMLFTIDMHDPFTQLLMYLPQSKNSLELAYNKIVLLFC